MLGERLALLGGEKVVETDPGDIFEWPLITKEHEAAALDVLRRGAMSGRDVTRQFEEEYAAWQGTKFALGCNNGTAALHSAMFGIGVGYGDEVISPSVTYWASALPAYSLGATVVFADIDPFTLCIDPNEIEKKITPRTKAIVAVHYSGHPCDMDAIMAIAQRHNIKVIEDVSHAHGALYKGRKVGSIGHVSGASLMSGKSFAVGEAGMMTTDDPDIFWRGIAFGHYARFQGDEVPDSLKSLSGLPLGGYKYRMHQVSSAVGRVELTVYDEKMAEIDKAMNHFWDLLEDVPGLRAHRPAKGSGSTMGGWYNAKGIYVKEELEGLSIGRFIEAVQAEGVRTNAGVNKNLHTHPVFQDADIYNHGKPTRAFNATRDVSQPVGSLPVSEGTGRRVFRAPWFKRFRPEIIEQHAAAFKKVALNYQDLLAGDTARVEDYDRITGA